MKKLLFILFSFFIQFGFAQNWDLFPYWQRSFYTDYDQTYIYELKQDSIYVFGGDSILYFNKKAPKPEWQECYNELKSNEYWVDNRIYIKRLIDSYLVKPNYIYGDYTFVFRTDITVGESWTNLIANPDADWDEITFSLDSVTYTEVIGQLDSVRYYSLHVDPSPTGDFAIDDSKLILSKNHGLLEYLDFGSLSAPTNCETCFKPFKLIGFINSEDTSGLVIPTWSDYFKLKPGDFLKFYNYSDYFGTGGYSTKEISEVAKYEDSVVVSYVTATGIFSQDVFYKKALQYILEGEDQALNYAPLFPQDTYYMPPGLNEKPVGEVDIIYLNNFNLPDQLTFDKEVAATWFQDSTTCELYPPFEGGNYYTFNSYLGLTSYSNCGYDYGCSGYYLVGSVLSGYATGNYWPVTIEEQLANQSSLSVFPNPANNYIQIDISTNKSFQYSIFTFDGKIISTSELTTNQINIENLIPGIYILEIKNENDILRGKFIKQ